MRMRDGGEEEYVEKEGDGSSEESEDEDAGEGLPMHPATTTSSSWRTSRRRAQRRPYRIRPRVSVDVIVFGRLLGS